MVENRHFKFCHCYFCWLYNITLDRRPLWSLVCLLFVAVELCTELKLSTERRSKEFAALTVEKTQIQSSIESVQHLQLLLILWVCQRQHPTHWLRRLTQRTRLWFLPSLIWVLDMHLEGHQVTIAPMHQKNARGHQALDIDSHHRLFVWLMLLSWSESSKLFTHVCLCHQAVSFGTSQRV